MYTDSCGHHGGMEFYPSQNAGGLVWVLAEAPKYNNSGLLYVQDYSLLGFFFRAVRVGRIRISTSSCWVNKAPVRRKGSRIVMKVHIFLRSIFILTIRERMSWEIALWAKRAPKPHSHQLRQTSQRCTYWGRRTPEPSSCPLSQRTWPPWTAGKTTPMAPKVKIPIHYR